MLAGGRGGCARQLVADGGSGWLLCALLFPYPSLDLVVPPNLKPNLTDHWGGPSQPSRNFCIAVSEHTLRLVISYREIRARRG